MRITTIQNRFETLIQEVINEYEQSFVDVDFGKNINPKCAKKLRQRKINEHRNSLGMFLFQLNYTINQAKEEIIDNWLDTLDRQTLFDYYYNIYKCINENPELKDANYFSSNSEIGDHLGEDIAYKFHREKMEWLQENKESIGEWSEKIEKYFKEQDATVQIDLTDREN